MTAHRAKNSDDSRRAEAFFELAGMLSEPVLALDEDLRLLDMNRAAESLLGRPREEAMGRHVIEAFGDAGYGHTIARLARTAVSTRRPVTARFTASRGEPHPAQWKLRARMMETPSGRWIAVVAALEGWHRPHTFADSKATETPDHFRVLVDLLPDMVFEWDADGRILYANAMVSELLGYTAEHLSTLSMGDLIRSDERDRFLDALGRMVSGEILYRGIQFHFVRANGSDLLAELSALVVHGPDLESRILAIARDQTKRSLLEQQLRLSEERYRQLFDCSRDLIFSLDAQGRVLDINRMGTGLTGRARHEILGKPFDNLILEPDVPFFRRALREASQGRTADVEVRLRGPNGRERILEVALAPVFEHGSVALVHGTARDVTERRALEQEVQQLQKMESLGRLAAGVAHDFNNILGAVVGLATVLRSELPEDHPLRADVEGILQAARQGADITRQVLSFAQAKPQERAPVDLRKLARDVTELLSHTLAPNTSIELKLPDRPIVVDGDQGQIRQVILNLCVNARDVMPAGGTVEVALQDGKDPTGRRWAELTVADRGPGIPEPLREKIFEPFFTTKDNGQSLGLGLSVCWGIVRNHGGVIRAEARPGGGTIFRVRLPLSQDEPLSSGEFPVTPSEDAAHHPRRVLVVDDQRIMREAASRMLSRLGYEVATAANWEEVEALCRDLDEGFDLYILDLALPEVDGYEIYRRLKERYGNPRAVAISGFYSDDLVERLLAEGVRAYLRKPFTIQELQATLEQVL